MKLKRIVAGLLTLTVLVTLFPVAEVKATEATETAEVTETTEVEVLNEETTEPAEAEALNEEAAEAEPTEVENTELLEIKDLTVEELNPDISEDRLNEILNPVLDEDIRVDTSSKTGLADITVVTFDENIELPEVYELRSYAVGSDYWGKYSSSFYRGKLNSAWADFYDRFYNVCMRWLTTNDAIDFSNPNNWIQLGGVSAQDAMNAYLLFANSNPQFYFLDSGMVFSYVNGNISVRPYVYGNFVDGNARADYTNQIQTKLDGWVRQVEAVSGPYNRMKKIYDLVAANVTYDYNMDNARSHQTVATAILYGVSVCAGYSELTEMLCQAVGINAITVTSYAHEWNQVKIDGRWYNADITWDDYGSSAMNYYFLVSDTVFRSGTPHHTPEAVYNGLRPECPYNYGSAPPVQISYVRDGIDYSAVFNPTFYATKYPDLNRLYGNDPESLFEHFLAFGMREGRQGSSTFNVDYYAKRYADLRHAFRNDLAAYYRHYSAFGIKEGRDGYNSISNFASPATVYNGINYSAAYDFNYYISKYSDIKKAFGYDDQGALAHFVNHGMVEGRQGSSAFSVTSYRLQYADLRRAFGNDLKAYYMHYVNYGKREGRKGTGCTTLQGATTVYNGINYAAVYDFNFYQSKYKDIKNIFGNDDVATLAHFVSFGMAEGRQGKASFDVNSYRNAYGDLRSAFGNDKKSYYMHYIYSGQREKRKATGVATLQNPATVYNGVNYSAVYDFNFYQSKYSDIKRIFGNDDVATLAHFVSFGMAEGRQGKASFDVNSYRNAYGDLRSAFGNDKKSYYMHYIYNGQREKRKATGVTTLQNATTVYNGVNYSAVYNFNDYQAKNPDIKKVFGNDEFATIAHFVNFGMNEGRIASSNFNVRNYRNRYSDLRNVFGSDWKSYFNHYINYGIKEKRNGK